MTTASSDNNNNNNKLEPIGDESEVLNAAYFANDVLPILETIFRIQGITYWWGKESMVGENELRKWMCLHGIPTLDDHKRFILGRWVSFTHVNFRDLTRSYRAFTADQILGVLTDKLRLQRTAQEGIFTTPYGDFWGTLDELRIELRRVDVLGLFRRQDRSLTKEERANLRFWAARATEAFPIHPDLLVGKGGENETKSLPEAASTNIHNNNNNNNKITSQTNLKHQPKEAGRRTTTPTTKPKSSSTTTTCVSKSKKRGSSNSSSTTTPTHLNPKNKTSHKAASSSSVTARQAPMDAADVTAPTKTGNVEETAAVVTSGGMAEAMDVTTTKETVPKEECCDVATSTIIQNTADGGNNVHATSRPSAPSRATVKTTAGRESSASKGALHLQDKTKAAPEAPPSDIVSVPPNDVAMGVTAAPPNDVALDVGTVPPNDIAMEVATAPPNDVALDVATVTAPANDVAMEVGTAPANDIGMDVGTAPPNDVAMEVGTAPANDIAMDVSAAQAVMMVPPTADTKVEAADVSAPPPLPNNAPEPVIVATNTVNTTAAVDTPPSQLDDDTAAHSAKRSDRVDEFDGPTVVPAIAETHVDDPPTKEAAWLGPTPNAPSQISTTLDTTTVADCLFVDAAAGNNNNNNNNNNNSKSMEQVDVSTDTGTTNRPDTTAPNDGESDTSPEAEISLQPTTTSKVDDDIPATAETIHHREEKPYKSDNEEWSAIENASKTPSAASAPEEATGNEQESLPSVGKEKASGVEGLSKANSASTVTTEALDNDACEAMEEDLAVKEESLSGSKQHESDPGNNDLQGDSSSDAGSHCSAATTPADVEKATPPLVQKRKRKRESIDYDQVLVEGTSEEHTPKHTAHPPPVEEESLEEDEDVAQPIAKRLKRMTMDFASTISSWTTFFTKTG